MKEFFEKQHESYGQIEISRVTTNPPTRFYGSNVKSSCAFRLSIHRSKTYVDEFGRRHFWPLNELIEVTLSQNQLAELITTFNIGHGVPCTINRFNGKRVEEYSEHENDLDAAASIVKDRMLEQFKMATNDIEKLKTMLKTKDRISKSDREEIMNILRFVTENVPRNAEFYLKQLGEVTEKITTQAKAEIDSMMTHAIHIAGLDAIQNKNLLENRSETTKE